MPNILIVEDKELSRENLRKRLIADIPGAEVTAAQDLIAAEDAVTAANSAERPFDAIVADVKVPVRKSGNPEASARLTGLLRQEAARKTCILQMTAHWPDDDVAENIIGQTVRKMAHPDWPGRVVTLVAELLVQRHMDSLFGDVAPPAPYSRSSGFRSQSLTFRLSDAMDDIRKYWNLLGDDCKQQVREHLTVSDSGDSVTLGGSLEASR
jgi:CheY-like chemotaxis protein